VVNEDKIYYVQSHQNDVLSWRAVTYVISTILEKNVKQCEELFRYFLYEFKWIMEEHICMVDVRGRGLLLALQLGEKPAYKEEEIHWDMIDKAFFMDYHNVLNSFSFPTIYYNERRDC